MAPSQHPVWRLEGVVGDSETVLGQCLKEAFHGRSHSVTRFTEAKGERTVRLLLIVKSLREVPCFLKGSDVANRRLGDDISVAPFNRGVGVD